MHPPKISIITRTRNRPQLLQRAVRSVLGQVNPPPWEWIVVNDAGDRDSVETVLRPAMEAFPDRLIPLHLESSQGMEHASNCGLSKSSGELLVIHDDDDSWEPAFLSKMSAWLDAPDHAKFAGVVCHSIRVVEEITPEGIKILQESPFNTWLEEISPWLVLEENPFPPISFLFRRDALDKVGFYDEALPVLGDWEFNLRLLMHWPLGVLPSPLARYHHRPAFTSGDLANSITASNEAHGNWQLRLHDRWMTNPPADVGHAFGPLARIAAASKASRTGIERLLSLPMRPGPQV